MDLFLPQRLIPLLAVTGAAASSVVYGVFRQHRQFYPSMVALAASNINMLCVYSFLAMLFCAAIRLVRIVLFGEVRQMEREQLFERAWFAFTETLLAMTIFRDEFNAQLITLFAFLLAIKCLHWLLQSRVEFMQQAPNFSWLFHFRCVATAALLSLVDLSLVAYAAYTVHFSGPSIQLLFGFEYLIQAVMVSATFVKYVIFVVELRRDDPWEARPIYMAYLNLFTDFLRLVIYVLFFLILFNYYSFPLHILRELFVTATSFLKRLHDLVRARRATANLNTRYPDATPAELAEDSMCTICREEMHVGKKLHCGHIFHLGCLRSWLQQNQTCPTCRADILVLEQQQAQQAATNAGAPAAAAAAPAAAVNNPAAPAAGTVPQPPANNNAAVPPPGMAMPAPGGWLPPPLAFPPHLPPPDPVTLMQFGLPPPPPPFAMPGFVPFYFDPEDATPLEQLTDSELAAMEGRERQHVTERIKFLRKFREELDAMLARFGQYESLTQRLAVADDTDHSESSRTSPAPSFTPAAASTTSPTTAATAASAASPAATSHNHNNNTSTNSTNATPPMTSTPSTAAASASSAAAPSSISRRLPAGASPNDDVRSIRVRKLSQQKDDGRKAQDE